MLVQRILFICLIGILSNSELLGLDKIEEDTVLAELVFQYATKGYNNLSVNLDTAEFYLKEALRLQYLSNNYEINDRVATNHILLYSVYRHTYNYREAFRQLNMAEEILQETDPNNLLFSNVYHNKGILYKLQNDLYRTKEYYEYALEFLIRNGYTDEYREFAHVYSSLINLYFELGEDDLARNQLNSLDISKLELSPQIEVRLYLIKAYSYSVLDDYKTAQRYFQLAYNLMERSEVNDLPNLKLTYYTSIIDFYMLNDEYDKALKECDKAIAYLEQLDPRATKSKTNYQSFIIIRSSTINYILGNYDKALRLADEGITQMKSFFQYLSLDEPTSTSDDNKLANYTELNIIKSRILFEQYLLSGSKDVLINCSISYKHSIDLLNSLKLAMQDEDSKVFATGQIIEVYKEAIFVGKLLFDLTGNLTYLEESFEFAENSKSFALLSEIKKLEAIEFSDLPPEVKESEDRFIGEIQYVEEQLYKELLSDTPDSSLVSRYKDRIFHLKDDYDNLVQEIEENYSQYYNLKYNPKFVTLKEVQDKLPYREALIEYVLTDTILITYVIDRKGINVFSQKIGQEFADECMEYYGLLHEQNFSNGVHQTYRRYVELGRKFYKILLEPCLQYTDRKSFTIIPDGAITYLPFEGLLTAEADYQYINYMTLPYTIKDYSIGYSHSSTLKFSKRLKTKSPEKKVLAFAPDYMDPEEYLDLNNPSRQPIEDEEILLPLTGAIKEVQSINETVPSKIFLNENATEANFKKFASDYNVLHLAMHTIMRDDEPLYSHLAFTNLPTQDTMEDNKLFAYEIYNMKLNAQMAVLSSCSSGFGKMQKGEGMMSLARGFIYAGCPSIIMTLWQVTDQSSSELMTSFYKYLKKGKSKQESMRLAKLDYLDSADDLTSNPYFWSGFVVVGDGNPIYRKSGMAYWMIIVTAFIGVLLYLQYRKP
jgi:CHAT domain-containing protein